MDAMGIAIPGTSVNSVNLLFSFEVYNKHPANVTPLLWKHLRSDPNVTPGPRFSPSKQVST